jgi:hypothetical protein
MPSTACALRALERQLPLGKSVAYTYSNFQSTLFVLDFGRDRR